MEKDKALSVFMGISLGLLPSIAYLGGVWTIASQFFTPLSLSAALILFLLLLLLGVGVGGGVGGGVGVVIGVVVGGVIGGVIIGGGGGGIGVVVIAVVIGIVVGGVIGGVIGVVLEEAVKKKKEKLSEPPFYSSFFVTALTIVFLFAPFVLAGVNLFQLERDREIFENISCFQKGGGIEIVFKDVEGERYIRNFYQISLPGDDELTIIFAKAEEEVKFEYSEERRLLKKEEKEEVTKTSLLKVFVPFEDTLSEIEVIARHTFLNYRKTIPVTPIPET